MTIDRFRGNEADIIKLMRSNRLKGLAEMASGMAHEINQPLGGIRGFAEGILIGLEEGWDISKDEIIAKMRRIISESDRIDELIQGVRGFADDGNRLETVDMDVLTAVKAAVRLMGTRLQVHGIGVTVSSVGLAPRVHANPFGLQEVVQILLSNAGDACLAREVSGPGQVEICVDGGTCGSDPILVCVKDNGIGMDDGTLVKAGEPFFTTKGPDRGVGLGLAMARGILTQCGGQLELRSLPGKGSEATVRLKNRCSKESGT
jgi:signal transduction histidine kinase